MCRLGSIAVGGANTGHGVAFRLAEPAPVDAVIDFEAWTTQISKGERNVVARTRETVDRNELLTVGLEKARCLLDLISFENRKTLTLDRSAEEHIAVFECNGAWTVEQAVVHTLNASVGTPQIVVTDIRGNVVPRPPQPPPVWHPALRHYRLSQASADLFDAYRSLWLGLESLLHESFPKGQYERERDWLRRALRGIALLVDLAEFVPNGTKNPVDYLIGTQYDYVRCNLFHAKDVRGPARALGPERVATAYQALLPLWRAIASRCYGVRDLGGGAIARGGFLMMMDGAFHEGVKFSFTDDPTPATKEDDSISPKGRPVHDFATATYLGESGPMRVCVVGTTPLQAHAGRTVHRVCISNPGVLVCAWSTEEALVLNDVHHLEARHTIRLLNRDLPRAVFHSAA